MAQSDDKSVQLAKLRASIDQIDAEFVKLLNQRAELVLDVKKTKQQENIDIYSSAREQEILSRAFALAEGGHFPRPALEKIFRTVVSATRSLIGEVVVAYVGPIGSASGVAAIKQFGESATYQPYTSEADIIARVERGEAHFGVIPAQLSSQGLARRSFDALIPSRLEIVAEVQSVEHFALASRATSLTSVRRVYADAYSFAATARWLQVSMPETEQVVVANASRAQSLAAEQADTAAIVFTDSVRDDLKVLAANIEDNVGGVDRFIVVGQTASRATGNDKTTLVFCVKDRAGVLHEILQPFATRGLTLLNIESKQIKSQSWDYVFFVDVLGHFSQPEVGEAIDAVAAICSYSRILGSYPIASILSRD